MRVRDLRQIRRRFKEVMWMVEHGYEPVYLFGECLWEKRHCGSLHTHRGALRDIERDNYGGRGVGEARPGQSA
jgi:hypothetical protein